MTPRDAAIATYADRERAMLLEARRHADGDRPGFARVFRHKALICHRAMRAELVDPSPVRVRRSA